VSAGPSSSLGCLTAGNASTYRPRIAEGTESGKRFWVQNTRSMGWRIFRGSDWMISYASYNSFRLRQLTGIPLTRMCEVACEIAYDTLLKDPELLERTIRQYSIRSPERQIEIDLKNGYEKVIADGKEKIQL